MKKEKELKNMERTKTFRFNSKKWTTKDGTRTFYTYSVRTLTEPYEYYQLKFTQKCEKPTPKAEGIFDIVVDRNDFNIQMNENNSNGVIIWINNYVSIDKVEFVDKDQLLKDLGLDL